MMWRIKQVLRRVSSTRCHNEPTKPNSSASTNVTLYPSAADTVLKTPELLEMILAHLDLNDLFFLQRVCRHWREIISSSTLLRRKLYLSPALKMDESIPVDNAWLKTRFPDLGVYLLQCNPKWRPKFIKALSSSDFERLGLRFFSGPNASWKDMLLTQPPIKEVVVYGGLEESSRPTSSSTARSGSDSSLGETFLRVPSSVDDMVQARVVVKNNTGVTMGMIFDASIEARRRSQVIARKKLTLRKDSGYASQASNSEVEIAIVEIEA